MQNQIRSIRVFLSSTFMDMQEEREYLVKHTFPAIRKIATQRLVDFSVVDLRWGVTEEDARQGRVIEVCLDEIRNTRPFFIGLLGNRYGWCPDIKDVPISQRLREKYPWLENCLQKGMSITHIEMQYGMLENTDPIYANFYIRDTIEKKTNQRLADLCHDIETYAGKKCQLEYFSSPQQLGKYVYASLLNMLDTIYPEDNSDLKSVLLDKQVSLLRLYRQGYAPTHSLQELEAAVPANDLTPWCILIKGESGEGKTALLSNWRENDTNVIRTLLNADLNTAVMAIEHFEAEKKRRASRADGLIWILDGIEFLQSERDRSLNWLNNANFAHVNLILSTNDEIMARCVRVFTMNTSRSLILVKMKPASNAEIQQIIQSFLKQFAKKLSPLQQQNIASISFFTNIYLLQLFLKELVQFGEYDNLNSFIKAYGLMKTKEQLIGRIFNRLECDYQFGIIQSFFGLLAATRYGMTEASLQQIIGLNAIQWAELSEAVSLMTIYTNGMLNLHPQIKEFASKRYMADPEIVERWRKQIIIIREQEFSQQLNDKFKLISHPLRFGWKIRYWFTAQLSQNMDTRHLIKIDTDLIWQYLCLRDYYSLARKRPYFHIQSVSDDRDVLMEMKRVYYENPKLFMRLLPPRVLLYLGVVNWPESFRSLCASTLKSKEENLQILRQHISDSRIPFLLKLRLTKYIDYYQERFTNMPYVAIEETWEHTALEDIDTDAITFFLAHEAPYLPKRRMERVEQEADKLIARMISQNYNNLMTWALLYAVKSFCCCSQNDFKSADDYFSAAVAISPTFNYMTLLRYIIALGLNDQAECEALIQLQSKEQFGEDIQPNVRENRLLLLYQILVLDHLSHFRQNEMVDTINKVLGLYPDNPSYAHYARYNTAALMALRGAYPLAAFLYQSAIELAPTTSQYVMDVMEAAECYRYIGEKERASLLLREAILTINYSDENREFVLILNHFLKDLEKNR